MSRNKDVLRCGHESLSNCDCAFCLYCDRIYPSGWPAAKRHMRAKHPLAGRVNAHIWKWVQPAKGRSNTLHRLATMTFNSDDCLGGDVATEGADWSVRNCTGTTVCGKDGHWIVPGLFSRMGALRCRQCCRKIGVPGGRGTPWNDKTLSKEEQAL